MTMEMLLKAFKGDDTIKNSVPLELRPTLPRFVSGDKLTCEVYYYQYERENGEFFLCAPEMKIVWDADKAGILDIIPLPGGERIGSMQDVLKGPAVKKQKEYLAFGDLVLSGNEAPDDDKWLSSMGEAFMKWYKNTEDQHNA